ncbi:MAG: adenylyl-sulfate kinase [Lysobacterales bacterium]
MGGPASEESQNTGVEAMPVTRPLLRFVSCGSVDDGKSTLIGRLLFECGALLDDQLDVLARDSCSVGTRGADIDYALLLDGLVAEREQGITIDVAYRFFATARRKFIVADTPGHEQYTRNMVTAASTADVAVLLVDARKGLSVQSRRHGFLASLLGVRQFVLAVSKMDLVGWSREVFESIDSEFRAYAAGVGVSNVIAIPVSGTQGDNVTQSSSEMPWYHGPTLLAALESAESAATDLAEPLRMPVQWVNRPHLDFRGFAGTIISGAAKAGDRICVMPSGRESCIERIVTQDGDLDLAATQAAVTLTLTDAIDVGRGDVICAAASPTGTGRQFEATIVWMHDAPLLRGRDYLIKLGAQSATATLAPIKYRIDIDTLEHRPTDQLSLNEIGVCEMELDREVAFEPYRVHRDLGGFIVIDRLTSQTVGAGLIHFALRRSANVHWQPLDVNRHAHSALKRQRPCVLWFTGLSGAGKSTIANIVEKQLHALGRHTYLLDGDNVRLGLNKDLGFDDADRVENIRRVAEVAKLMTDAGLIVLTSFISPFRAERAMARARFADDEFIEIHVDTPLAVAEDRDVKGLYRKARDGRLKNFTGIDSPYEAPEHPELRVDTTALAPGHAADRIIAYLRDHARLDFS